MVEATLQESRIYFQARLAEDLERFDDMKKHMYNLVTLKKNLSVDERNLLSIAYKNAVGSRRAIWRNITDIEAKYRNKGNIEYIDIVIDCRVGIEEELCSICYEIIKLLDLYLIPTAPEGDCEVFYHKMKGDYYRYIAEISVDAKRKEATENAKNAYETANQIAQTHLDATHPIRLGLILNYSVFYYEILGQIPEACAMAQNAFESALALLETVTEDSYKDSTLILQLLRDNLNLWTLDPVKPIDEDVEKSANYEYNNNEE